MITFKFYSICLCQLYQLFTG